MDSKEWRDRLNRPKNLHERNAAILFDAGASKRLATAISHSLVRNGLTVHEAAELPDGELLTFHNFGRGSLEMLRKAAAAQPPPAPRSSMDGISLADLRAGLWR